MKMICPTMTFTSLNKKKTVRKKKSLMLLNQNEKKSIIMAVNQTTTSKQSQMKSVLWRRREKKAVYKPSTRKQKSTRVKESLTMAQNKVMALHLFDHYPVS
ncbi:hypothetical protein Goshw_006508, partial [Gossypium schwendimanii]|nr:hypothetical protein [Gossypium schwendimanii]